MDGEIEDYVALQADHLPTGSISFGRFEAESLLWERRSSFSHNKYLEEVEKYSTPGSVTQKKAYFEAHFKKKALEHQASSESQTDTECQITENYIAECDSYLNEFENHDDVGQLQFSWYDETSHAVDDHQQEEIAHEQVFDFEEIDYEQEVIDYEQEESPLSDFPIEDTICVDEISDSIVGLVVHGAAPEAQSENERIQSDKDPLIIVAKHKLKNEADNVEGLCERDCISSKSSKSPLAGKGPTVSMKKTQKIFPKVMQTVGEETSEPKSRMGAKNSRYPASEKNSLSLQITKPVRNMERESIGRMKIEKKSPLRVSPSTSSRSRNLKSEDFGSLRSKVRQHDGSERDLRAKKSIVTSQSICEKSESNLRQSANRPEQIVNQTKEVKTSGVFKFRSDERAEKRKEFYMKLEEKHHAREVEMNEIQARAQEVTKAEIKQFRRSLNFKATPMPSFYHESVPRASSGKKMFSKAAKSPTVRIECSSSGDKAAAEENSVAHSEVSNEEGSSTAEPASSPEVNCPATSEGDTSCSIPDNKPDKTDKFGDGSQATQPSKKMEEGKKEGKGKLSIQQEQVEDKLKGQETLNKVRRGVKGRSEVMGKGIKGGIGGNLAVHFSS